MGLLAALAGALSLELVRQAPVAEAQIYTPNVGGDRLLAMPAQLSEGRHGLFLVDREAGIIAVYEYSNGRELRLVAARNFTYDLQLDEYNTTPPPSEVQEIVRQGRRLGSSDAP